MKKCILIISCVMVMGVSTAMANEISLLQKFEQRTIAPYAVVPTTPTVPTSVKPIQKMPFHQDEYNKKARPHFMPYIRLSPTHNGRGLGTEFGFKFGIFKSHGLGFGINLF